MQGSGVKARTALMIGLAAIQAVRVALRMRVGEPESDSLLGKQCGKVFAQTAAGNVFFDVSLSLFHRQPRR